MAYVREAVTWITFSARLPKTVANRIRQECRVRGLSQNAVVKWAVLKLLEDEAEMDRMTKVVRQAKETLYARGQF